MTGRESADVTPRHAATRTDREIPEELLPIALQHALNRANSGVRYVNAAGQDITELLLDQAPFINREYDKTVGKHWRGAA